MHTYTTTYKVQPSRGGLQIHTFKGEAKDKHIAEERAYERLIALYDEDLSIVSHSTKAGDLCDYDRRDFQAKQKRQRH